MIEQPKRLYEVKITAGADDLRYLRSMILMALDEMEDNYTNDNGYHAVSGGHSGNHIIDLKVSPEQTHEKYFVEMATYLANKKQPFPPTNPITVSLDAKERLISERGLTEADFIQPKDTNATP